MKLIQIEGLSFRVHSPSNFELLSVRDDIVDPDACVRVCFDGETWMVDYRSSMTHLQRPFKSRDAAIALIVDRRS